MMKDSARKTRRLADCLARIDANLGMIGKRVAATAIAASPVPRSARRASSPAVSSSVAPGIAAAVAEITTGLAALSPGFG